MQNHAFLKKKTFVLLHKKHKYINKVVKFTKKKKRKIINSLVRLVMVVRMVVVWVRIVLMMR